MARDDVHLNCPSHELEPSPRPPELNGSLQPSGEVTRILSAIERGDDQAAERLLPLVYDELRRLAANKLTHEKPGPTFQATDLVHEAYLRLVDVEKVQHWNSRGHFFAAAGEAMRRILVERARRRGAADRAMNTQREQAIRNSQQDTPSVDQLLAVHEVLDKLAAIDRPSADLVKLRYFMGMTMDEAADALGISVRSAHHVWTYARSWLHHAITRGGQ